MNLTETPKNITYDLSLYALGYESRSMSIPNKTVKNSKAKIAVGYNYNNKFAYDTNLKFFEKNGVEIFQIDENKLEDLFSTKILPLLKKNNSKNILIDITSMSRYRFAILIWLLLKTLKEGSKIIIKYSISKFVSPLKQTTPVKKIEPIIPYLSGIPGDLNFPTSCIVGLGYEKSKAQGAVNFIDPGELWVLIPQSIEKEFEPYVLKNNKSLLEEMPNNKKIYYDVHNPLILYGDLKSLVLGLKSSKRPMIIPLGPKILCALSVILGFELQPELPVWRVSSLEQEKPVDRVSNGKIISFTVEI